MFAICRVAWNAKSKKKKKKNPLFPFGFLKISNSIKHFLFQIYKNKYFFHVSLIG